MPTLYRLSAAAPAIARAFNARVGDDPWAGGLISPQNFAPVVTAGREFIAGPRPAGKRLERRMIPRLWGVPPPPSARDAARPVLTVRNPDSPFWIGNLRNSEFRCLVPTTSFMVWGKSLDAQGARLRHWFTVADQPLFAFAGVWKDSEVPSFAVLTCDPNAMLRNAGRETMPVILPADPQAYDDWLYADWARAARLIAPYSSSLMCEDQDSSGNDTQ
ncbi:MAG: SOS response-associated peptidase family protein [Novosphingobium sp.]|nr:SOS response-associated peptidase family protein [Novosphingobium sp.]